MSRISALVVARNEAGRLPALLASLEPADEVVVVLDRSTDSSLAIAWKHAHRVIEGAWATEGERRNAGLEACTGDWVLEVEADETVPPELWEAIRRVAGASSADWHPLRVDNHVGERLIRHGWTGRLGSTHRPALFRRGAKRWRACRLDPGPELAGTAGEAIPAPGLHRVLEADISGLLRRLDERSSALAADLLAEGQVGTLPGHVRRFLRHALGSLLRRGGWRDGGWGVLLALLGGMEPLVAHLKARLEPERHRDSSWDAA